MKKYYVTMLACMTLALNFTTWPLSLTAAETGLSVKFEMPRDASVSLGLFDSEGHLLRWLRQDEFTRKGAVSVAWDGLDQWGEPVPAGNYLVKGVWYGPVGLAHEATVNNPGTPPWPTADGKGDWLADESSPQAAVTDGKWVFLGAPCSEDGFSIIALDEHGQRQWGVKGHFNPRCSSLAVDGDYLYVLYSGPTFVEGNKTRHYTGDNAEGRAVVFCYEKQTGRLARFSLAQPSGTRIATWPYRNDYHFMWDLRNSKGFTPAKNGGQPRYFDADACESTNALGIAALKDKFYIAYFYDNKVVEYNAETAEPTGLEIPVDAPVGLHAADAQTILAVSGEQVVKIDLKRKVVESFITSGLVAPAFVTTDRAGNVYVSDWKDSFQVKQFNPSGKFVKAIGKAGGRPWLGKFDPDGMLLPRGVAVTDEGRLWVAEDDISPRRVSVWDTASGKLVRDYIGPANYGGGGYFWMDPKDRTHAVSDGVLFKVDYALKNGAPLATVYRKVDLSDTFVPNAADTSKPAKILYHGKDEFAFFTHDRNTIYVLLKREGDIYQQAAAIGFRFDESGKHLIGDGTGKAHWDSDIGYHCYENNYPLFFKNQYAKWYAWNDKNSDYRTQENEMTWLPRANVKFSEFKPGDLGTLNSGWGGDIGQDFSLYFGANFQDCNAVFRLPVKEWSVTGSPVYDLRDAKPVVKLDRQYGINGIYVTRDDKILVTYSHEWQKGKNSIECYDTTGKLVFAIAMPAKQEGKGVHGTGVIFDYQLPGLGTVCGTWGWHGSTLTYLFTTSGDYLAAPLTDNHDSGPFSAWGESFRGGVQYGDQPYLLNGGNQQLHILKLSGLEKENVGRFEIPYKLDNAMIAKAEAVRNQPKPRVIPPPVIGSVWKKTAPVIDGKLDDWDLREAAALDKGDGRKALVALARDKDTLYLAAQVWQTTPPLRNQGNDWQRLFMSGDCVDLMLRTNTQAGANERAAIAGDLRLLLSVFDNQLVAVLYEPVVSGSEKKPVQMLATTLDRVTRLTSAKVAAVRQPGDGYYVIEAAIPLKDLNLDPKNYDSVSGDVGVIFADGSGRNRALRLYYYNHSQNAEIVNDLTTEATLQPGEWGKIQLPLGENILKNSGFEEALADSDTAGWVTWDNKSNLTKIELDPKVSYSGRQSLHLALTAALDIPDEGFKLPDFGAFLKSAKNATSEGRVAVGIRQKVPVTAGHQYSLRYSFVAYDIQPDSRELERGKRGFAAFSGAMVWNTKPAIYTGLGGADGKNREEWTTIKDYGAWFISQPFTAPAGATEAAVNFTIDVRTADRKTEVWLDNVELVDLTERDE